MRNLKKVLSLALAMVMLIGMMVVGASATTFSDDADIKNQEAVDVVSGIGILTGIGDGSFNPEGTLTRAEAAVVIAKLDLGAAFGNLETTNAATFDDVGPKHWGKAYIDYCAARGLIAGDGNGKFMPDDKVTGVEFGLMVSRVLGYEDANEDVSGVNWTVKAAALARKAGLTKDVILTDTAISRDDMAQVAYNALQADLVEYDGRAITIGDVVIPAGKATPVQHISNNYAHYIYNTNNTLDPNVQLCEEKFPNLRLSKSTTDYNGRPSNVWTYGTNNVISSVAHEATFEIKDGFNGAKVASTLGQAPLGAAYNWTYYIDGKLQSASGSNGEAMRLSARSGSTTYFSGFGNGATTYIYVDDTEGKASVTVCVINIYGGEVTKTTDTDVTVDGMTFASTAFEEDDVVLYTKGYDTAKGEYVITSMEAAEMVEGNLTKVTADTSFVVDSTTYKYNYTMTENHGSEIMTGENVKNDVSFYVDHAGNMVYPGEVITEVDYAVVLNIVEKKNTFDDLVYYARLLKTNGSVVEVSVNKNWIGSGDPAAKSALQGFVVSYAESDGKYTLTKPTTGSNRLTDTTSNLVIAQGVSRVRLGAGITGYADDNTVFLVKNNDNTYSVYKGYKNVPTITVKDNGDAASVASYCRNGKAVVVYVQNADVDTSGADDVIFVVGNPKAKLITESNGNKYYEFKAVVNKEATTIQVLAGTDLATALRADTVKVYRALKTNSKGLVTDAYNYENARTAALEGTSKISSSVIGFGAESYAYDTDTMIVKYDGSDLTIGNASLVKNDKNDKVWLVEKDGKLLGAFIKEVADDDDDDTTTTEGNVTTALTGSTADVTYAVNSNGRLSATFDYQAPDYAAATLANGTTANTVTVDVDVYALNSRTGKYDLLVGKETGIPVQNLSKTGAVTFSLLSNYGEYDPDQDLKFVFSTEKLGAVVVKYVDTNNRSIDSMMTADTTKIVDVVNNLTLANLKAAVDSTKYTGTAISTVTSVTGATGGTKQTGGTFLGTTAANIYSSGTVAIDGTSAVTVKFASTDLAAKTTFTVTNTVKTAKALSTWGVTGNDASKTLAVAITSATASGDDEYLGDLANNAAVAGTITLSATPTNTGVYAYHVVSSKLGLDTVLANNTPVNWSIRVTGNMTISPDDITVTAVDVLKITDIEWNAGEIRVTFNKNVLAATAVSAKFSATVASGAALSIGLDATDKNVVVIKATDARDIAVNDTLVIAQDVASGVTGESSNTVKTAVGNTADSTVADVDVGTAGFTVTLTADGNATVAAKT